MGNFPGGALMALAHRWADRNLTRLELGIALMLMASFVGVFIVHALRVFASAEAGSLQATIVNVETSLRIMFYQLILDGRTEEAATWRGANPAALLRAFGARVETETLVTAPELARFGAVAGGFGARYTGEFDAIDPALVDGGYWYFDRADSALVYRVRNTEFFRSSLPGPARVRFRLELLFDDINGDGEYNPEAEQVLGVTLKTLDQFEWSGLGKQS
jgi:hypothetical protein